jgi:hypothetical protein
MVPVRLRRLAAILVGTCACGAVAVHAERPVGKEGSESSTVYSDSLDSKRTTVRKLACDARVPPDFALAVLDKESGFNNGMRGSMGEIGASQILPSTAVSLGLDVKRLAAEFSYNAQAGIAILRGLLAETRGDQLKALLSYRAGPRWLGLPPRAQNRVHAYASAVVDLMRTRYSGVACQ